MQHSICTSPKCFGVISWIGLHTVEDAYGWQPYAAQEHIIPINCMIQSLLLAAVGMFLCQPVDMIS